MTFAQIVNTHTGQGVLMDGSAPAPTTAAKQRVSRMSDPSAVRSLLSSCRERMGPLWEVYDAVQSKLDCEPPDTRQALTADGIGHLTNVCWGSLESKMSEAVEPLVNLLQGGRTFLRFVPRRKRDELLAASLKELAESHKEMLWSWPSRQPRHEAMVTHRTALGLGVFYRPLITSWKYDALHPRNLVYPANASGDVDSWPFFGIITTLEIPFLIQQIANDAPESGWRKGDIRAAIQKFNDGALAACDSAIRNPGSWQETHGANDLTIGMGSRGSQQIPAIIFYIKEWDGTISERVLLDCSEPRWLFVADFRHSAMSDVISIFPHEIQQTLRKLRGLGVKQLAMHDTLDRLQNHEVDLAFMSGLIMQAADGQSLRKVSEVVFGPSVIIPPGLSVQQTSFKDTGLATRSLKQDMRSQLAATSASFGGSVDVGETERTNQQFSALYADRTQVRGFMVDRFANQCTQFCAAHWKAVLASSTAPEVVEMVLIAAENGFDPEHVSLIRRVEHYTGSARGNKVTQMMAYDRSRSYWGMFSEQGKREFARQDMALAFADELAPDHYLGAERPADWDTRQTQAAFLENAAFHGGDPVPISNTDSHILHLQAHVPFAVNLVAACQAEQEDPRVCLLAIVAVLRHCAPSMLPQRPGEAPSPPGHLDMLAQDPMQDQAVKAYAQQLSQIENARRQLEQRMSEQARAAAQQQGQQQPQLDPVTQARLMTEAAVREQRIADFEVDRQIKVEKHQLDLSLKGGQTNLPASTLPTPNATQGYPAPVNGSPSFGVAAPDQLAVPGPA